MKGQAKQPFVRAASTGLASRNSVRASKHKIEHIASWPLGDRLRVEGHRIANGLRVLSVYDPSAPVVSYQTWFRVGSFHENQGKTGLAHLFEHLMFNETKNLPYGTFDRTIEGVGGETNAATWVDWTFYYENVPSRHFELVARLESERMSNLVLREKQVRSEKEVVANERRFRVDDDVEGSANEELYKLAFEKHPYHWPTIGWMSDIENFTTQDCEAFYGTYYAPNNATLVVVGNVTTDQVLKTVRRYYGRLKSAQLPQTDFETEPDQTEERFVELRKPTPTQKLLLGYKGPAFTEDDHAVMTVLNEILLGGRSGRLYRALVSEGELASEVRGSVAPFKYTGLYEIWVSMRDNVNLGEGLKVIEAELEKLQNQDVGVAELDKIKNRIELHFLQGLETASGKAEQIGFYDTVWGSPEGVMHRLEAYRRVSPSDVRNAAQHYCQTSRRTRVHVLPI